MTAVDELGTGKYISVTTFKKDGTAVATPVWLVQRRGELLVLTQAASGKAKRLRNNPRVLVAPCDARGTLKGAMVGGTARLQDEIETHLTASMIQHRYGFMGRVFSWLADARNGNAGGDHVGITITLDE
ncbi:MAG: PPOX class F420-dependent oxidoreductase [Actinobacteria bacterium]|jgi:hypothetical protein|nr:PPOX class F420-dependent oxidoreductase [Actinomycetota bacterium]